MWPCRETPHAPDTILELPIRLAVRCQSAIHMPKCLLVNEDVHPGSMSRGRHCTLLHKSIAPMTRYQVTESGGHQWVLPLTGCVAEVRQKYRTAPGPVPPSRPFVPSRTKEVLSRGSVSGVNQPRGVYADAGDDGEWVQEYWHPAGKVESLIKPAAHRLKGQLNGLYQSERTADHLKYTGNGRRCMGEFFMGGLKRTTGPPLFARSLFVESPLGVLADAVGRLAQGIRPSASQQSDMRAYRPDSVAPVAQIRRGQGGSLPTEGIRGRAWFGLLSARPIP
jgi:hypothetical protein